jgi:hypothetical protein
MSVPKTNGPRHHPYPGGTSRKGKAKVIDDDEEIILQFDTIFYPYPVSEFRLRPEILAIPD